MSFKINPGYADLIKGAVKRTATSRALLTAAQKASPGLIQAAQRIFQARDLIETIFGERFEDKPNPLMGHMTPRQVMEVQQRIREMGPARRNLFYIQVTDGNIPRTAGQSATTATDVLRLLATDVSYNGRSIASEKLPIGAALMDRPTGIEPVEVSITTMDDEVGSLKRWFHGKLEQIAHTDGTFGVPSEYQVDIEIVHGIASPDIDQKFVARAYTAVYTVRAATIQHELTRRDQGPEEIQMTFSQTDSWTRPPVAYVIGDDAPQGAAN